MRSLLFPRRLITPLLVALGALSVPTGLTGQDDDLYRFGITLGGTSLVSLNVEFMWGDAALDIAVGTWAFRDVSVSAVGKYYMGGGNFRPVAGAGLWLVTQFPTSEDEQTGFALVGRVPVAFEGRFADEKHALGLEVNLSRALWIRRPDPDDDFPPAKRIVPLPGFYYRVASDTSN